MHAGIYTQCTCTSLHTSTCTYMAVHDCTCSCYIAWEISQATDMYEVTTLMHSCGSYSCIHGRVTQYATPTLYFHIHVHVQCMYMYMYVHHEQYNRSTLNVCTHACTDVHVCISIWQVHISVFCSRDYLQALRYLDCEYTYTCTLPFF